jgi:hypothetical protein
VWLIGVWGHVDNLNREVGRVIIPPHRQDNAVDYDVITNLKFRSVLVLGHDFSSRMVWEKDRLQLLSKVPLCGQFCALSAYVKWNLLKRRKDALPVVAALDNLRQENASLIAQLANLMRLHACGPPMFWVRVRICPDTAREPARAPTAVAATATSDSGTGTRQREASTSPMVAMEPIMVRAATITTQRYGFLFVMTLPWGTITGADSR